MQVRELVALAAGAGRAVHLRIAMFLRPRTLIVVLAVAFGVLRISLIVARHIDRSGRGQITGPPTYREARREVH